MDYQSQIDSFFSKYPLISVKKDRLIIDPFEKPRGIYFIKRGYVRQYNISKEGKELTIHIHTPLSHFPMFYAYDLFENRYYFSAMTNLKIHIAPKTDVVKFLENNPDCATHFTKRLLLGMEGLIKRLEVITFGNAQTRVVSALIYISKHFGEVEKQKTKINTKFTHERLATLTGLTREHVSLELEKLEKKNLITYKNRMIIILDIDKLNSYLQY